MQPYLSTEASDLALSRAIYNPTLLSPFLLSFPTPCILYSEFHSSFLSHLVFLRSGRRLLVTASLVPSSQILVTLMKDVLTRATRRNISEDTILHEECRLLGYKNPVRTSQETHYFSATESSRLILCKI
jgi:hypothetical protein